MTLGGNGDAVTSATFSPDGQQVISGSDDSAAKVWSAASGECPVTLEGHTSCITSATFQPDGQHVLTVSGGGAMLWSALSG